MNKVSLIVTVFLLSCNIFSKETYPVEKSYKLETGLSSGFVNSFSGGSGGTIEFDVNVVDLYENISIGLSSGYSYLDESDVINFADIGLSGGYVFHINSLFRLNPAGSFSIIIPINGAGGVTAEVSAGFEVDFHVYERNLLFIKSSVSQCFNDQIGPSFTLQLGIKRSLPMFIAVPPVKSRLLLSPERFSPDGDGSSDEMQIKLNIKNPDSVKRWKVRIQNEAGLSLYKWSGNKKPPKVLNWDGYSEDGEVISSATDYRVILDTVDYLGNRSSSEVGFLSDILVINDNNRLRINVPSIIFPPNSADQSRLTMDQRDKNNMIIGIIASKLNKYPDYSIRIEGHGNIVNWDSLDRFDRENSNILIPLTTRRAEAVKNLLVKEGMDEKKITISGLGGSFPIVPFSDKVNNWKNRRVEFILLK